MFNNPMFFLFVKIYSVGVKIYNIYNINPNPAIVNATLIIPEGGGGSICAFQQKMQVS